MVLIKKYRVRANSNKRKVFTLPSVYTEEVGLKIGDTLLAYREDDKLILVPEKKKE
jgi:bifunctional DNA-binding transcriptional regulator/antitoxin component of YhaV-PrlF toxin-antitoxin module